MVCTVCDTLKLLAVVVFHQVLVDEQREREQLRWTASAAEIMPRAAFVSAPLRLAVLVAKYLNDDDIVLDCELILMKRVNNF